jgi:DNA-directed RNA polymerase II subunit RPB1
VCVLLQANRPVMGIVQDTLLGSQKITKRDVFIERDLMMNMVMWMKHWEGYIPPPAVMLPTKGQPGLWLHVCSPRPCARQCVDCVLLLGFLW